MVRLNKNKLEERQLYALFDQLNTSLCSLKEKDADLFLRELLGVEERIMLAKRFAIIILLLENKSLYSIAELIKVSPTTAERIKRGIDSGEYDHIIQLLGRSKKNYFAILETLDSILHLGGILPHYNGLERYRTLR